MSDGFQVSPAIVIRGLRQGFGAEDIAIREGRPVADVRACIRWLRRIGMISQIYKGKSA